MGRKETWKNVAYPNARPMWQKHVNREFNMLSDKRDKYFSRLKFNLPPNEYLRNFKLYKKYALLTKSEIDQDAQKIAAILIRTKIRYGEG